MELVSAAAMIFPELATTRHGDDHDNKGMATTTCMQPWSRQRLMIHAVDSDEVVFGQLLCEHKKWADFDEESVHKQDDNLSDNAIASSTPAIDGIPVDRVTRTLSRGVKIRLQIHHQSTTRQW